MATSGWQNEQTWFTYSSNIRLIGNIRVDSITHTGTNLRIKGAIAAGARGSSNYYFTYSDYTSYAQPEGGSKIALGGKGKTWKVGGGDVQVAFDVTISNVSTSTTSRSFYVNFYGPNTNSVKATLRWTLSFNASGTAPTGGYIYYADSTWNSIKATIGISSWGGITGEYRGVIVTGSTNGSADTVTTSNWETKGRRDYRQSSSSTSLTFTATTGNTVAVDSPIDIKGLLHYKLAWLAKNTAGTIKALGDSNTLRYLPPAPPKLTYTDPGGEGTKDFAFTFTGEASNNHTTYDTASLTRTVRYKVNDAAEWTYVANASEALIGDNTTFTVRVPGSQSAVVEGWMTYHGIQSEVKTVTVYNGNAPSRVYGSVEGESKLLYKLYGSVGGESKEIIKLYGSVDGEAKAILG